MHVSPTTARVLQSAGLSRWTLGTLLCLDRRHVFESHATPEQVAGVYAEPVPDCCAGVGEVCRRWALSDEATAAVVDIWGVWHS